MIPSTRGASRSRPVAHVLAEVSRLAAAGYKELWLVGVHLGSYGRDLAPAASLIDLLRALDGAPGDVSYRISSLEPMDCSPEVVELVAGSGRFAPHVHLPLQHGGDRVLGAMRRPYSAAYFRDLVGDIHGRMPNASIGTDVIVGFPGESDADAGTSERVVEALPLSYVHVFPYLRSSRHRGGSHEAESHGRGNQAPRGPHARNRRAPRRTLRPIPDRFGTSGPHAG